MDFFFGGCVDVLSSANSEGHHSGTQQIICVAVYFTHVFSSSMEGNEAKRVICRSVLLERTPQL